jgi:UDP-glucuronate decarboxylase
MIKNESKKLTEKFDFSSLYNKKILITGASGLVGLYLLACLNEAFGDGDVEVYSWIKSDLETETKEIFSKCKIIQGDICDPENFVGLPKFDLIIHCAGYGQPGKFLENKIKTISLNTTATIKLFDCLSNQGKFIFVSTSELYSGLDLENINESQIGTSTTDHPRACYIEGKRCGESICHAFSEQGFDVKIIRLSLAYGPGTKIGDKRVLNSLIEKGIKNDRIDLLDQGDAIRTYCYITDVIEMFWNIILNGKKIKYNVGGLSKTTILDLAEIIGTQLNKKVTVPKNEKGLSGTPKIVNISIQSYLDEFGPHEFISLNEGIKKTINWQKKLYEKNYV